MPGFMMKRIDSFNNQVTTTNRNHRPSNGGLNDS